MTITRSLATNALHGIPPYVFRELDVRRAALRERGRSLLDVSIGSPDQPIPEPVVEALRVAAGDRSLSNYPRFSGDPIFLEAVATFMRERFGVAINTDDEVLAVAGSKEGLAELVLATCSRGDVVLVPDVHYPVYARAALLAGAEPLFVPTERNGSGRLMLETLAAADVRRARILIANYPCNPTTAIASRDDLARLVEFAEANDVLLVSDLAYSEMSFDGYVVPSIFEIPGARNVAVEMHSCSKTFNMAGLRIGFVAGNAAAIAALDQYRSNVGYGVSMLPQRGAAVAFAQYATLVPPIMAEYRRRRDAFAAALNRDGWSAVAPKATMYFWLDVPPAFGDWEWVDALLEGPGVVVTPGIAFGAAGKGKFRVSLVQPVETLVAVAAALAETAAVRPL